MASYYSDDDDFGSDNSMDEDPGSQSNSEDAFCSQSDDSSEYLASPPTIYMYLITLVEVNVRGSESSRVLGAYTTKEKAIKAARFIMKRRSGCYPVTGRCDKPYKKDHTATVGDQGTLYEESNDYSEQKSISLAKIPVNKECNLRMTGPE
jgi:hypothetical protein